jgi:hypothetical protein
MIDYPHPKVVLAVVGVALLTIGLLGSISRSPLMEYPSPLRCPNLPPIPRYEEATEYYYNSIAGVLILMWPMTATGEELRVIFQVLDVGHELAADYSIKTEPFPTFVQWFRGTQLIASWRDMGGQGRCADYKAE